MRETRLSGRGRLARMVYQTMMFAVVALGLHTHPPAVAVKPMGGFAQRVVADEIRRALHAARVKIGTTPQAVLLGEKRVVEHPLRCLYIRTIEPRDEQ